jgi:Domain of unknown function (DUF4282)
MTDYPQQPPPGPPPQQPPPGGGYPSYPGPEGGRPADRPAGFFKALFDFSFTHFVTPKIVKFAYVLATILLALIYVGLVISGFASDEPAYGLIVLVLGAVGFIVYLALIRMTLELYVSIVRMSEDIHKRLPGG